MRSTTNLPNRKTRNCDYTYNSDKFIEVLTYLSRLLIDVGKLVKKGQNGRQFPNNVSCVASVNSPKTSRGSAQRVPQVVYGKILKSRNLFNIHYSIIFA